MTKTVAGSPHNPNKAFYDQGWNDRVDNVELAVIDSTYHYRDGWKDCDQITEAERKEIGKI